jgi:hypothetical protein
MFNKINKATELLLLVDKLQDKEVKYRLYCKLQEWVEETVSNTIKEVPIERRK